jgi:pimeloyl-ACP methyl ester carboxylesterase
MKIPILTRDRITDWWQQHFPQGQQRLTIPDASGREVSIAYGEAGSGQPLLLLHGIGSWSYNWRHNIQPLSQHFRVICVDAKGYGFSETPPLPEVVGHQVIELSRVIRELCHSPVMIAAESLGALTALAMTQSYPELVDRLVLINAPVFPQQLPSSGMRSLSNIPLPLVEWVDRNQLVRPFTPLVQQMTRLIRQEVVFDPSQIADEDIYWLTYPYLHIPGTLTQFAADLHLAAQEIDRFHRKQPNLIQSIQDNLPDVTCPTLILWSDCDRWFPVENGELLHARLPNSQFQIVPNCGHVASSGNPDVVNAAIVEHGRASE